MSSERDDEECDARDDDQGTEAGLKKKEREKTERGEAGKTVSVAGRNM
ncbi:MAG: hypothetical protein U0U70_09060 [Chitinophagaceae bacterium]